MNRRKFLQNVVGVTTLATLASSTVFSQNSSAKLKIVVFWQNGFPIVDGLNITREKLQSSLANHDLIFAIESELASKLSEDIDVFINPYGSAFPKKAWNAILKYLQNGGNFLNLGGVPFAVPVQNGNKEIRQVNYHKRLGITQSFPIDGRDIELWSADSFQRPKAEKQKLFSAEEIYEFYLKLSNVNDFPDEAGSDGRREAKVESLIFGLDKNKRRIAAPIIQIDRLLGEFAGGRWMLANFKGEIDADLIKNLAERAVLGAVEFIVKPEFACFRKSDIPKISTKLFSPYLTKKKEIIFVSYTVNIKNSENSEVGFKTLSDDIKAEPIISEKFDISQYTNKLKEGFFQIDCEIEIRFAYRSSQIIKIRNKTGFWILDKKLLSTGEPFTADRHFLYRNYQPFPVVGTTYMSSDVARRFLLEPNPAVWDKDFAEMKAAGVNMIRTGIWTGWKLYFDEKGEVKEEVLRAFEAFILTAKKYDIPVIFTFFAFMPEMFGGKNAYLDPKSFEGQKKFLSAFALRVKSAKDLIWDLINEPSFANPKNLWSCRPNYDEFEKAAWKEFLKKRFSENDEQRLSDILKEKWRLRDDENPFELPTMEDFDNYNIAVKRRPLKALEFRLFAQEIFKQWAKEMSETLKKAGNSSQMVTVGQDEAGNSDSPTSQFHEDVLDFTCLHNWWANDELLWDNVMMKSPSKPNLVQETGLMFYEKQDGSVWRDEQTNANLLERKMALSLGANGCGFIEWIWNINPFMDNENEAAIGFHRVDGTAKKELESFVKIAKFANENRQYFKDKQDEKTLLVIPHSYQFLPRNFAQEATRKAVRVFHYYCRRTLRAVSEYNLQSILKEENPPALIILPSVNCFNQKAWGQLLELIEKGSTLAISGYFADDEHLIPQDRLKDLGSQSIYPPIPVSHNERMTIEGKIYRTHFGGEKIQQVRRADFYNDYLLNFSLNGNEVLWSPVPLEIGENMDAIKAFYDSAIKKAKLLPYFSLANDIPTILVRPTEFEKAILYLVMNESGNNELVELTHLPTKTKIEINLEAGKTSLIFVDKQTGKVLSRT
ncbi:MAG TPA: cellulase family glycosylhydrolase [Pyrinomonadaceae bacterium]|nr:cellulase family glycosylhydrolase [Pyrinomonadaceae bacterium]